MAEWPKLTFRFIFFQAMSDPPPSSKLLPTLSSASSSASDHSLSRRSCADAFFQLFDWNCRLHKKRRFRHTILPAERPSLVSNGKICGDEKLPMANMLLVADDRGGFPQGLETKPGDALQNDQTPEKKKKKRTPSVVAKLMGLETMPSPEPHREGQPFFAQNTDSMQNLLENPHSSDLRISSFRENPNPNRVERKIIEKCAARQELRREALLRDPPHKQNDESRLEEDDDDEPQIPIKFEDPKPLFFSKIPAAMFQSGEGNCTLRPIISPLKAHNRMVSPIKRPLAAKGAVCLFEAATKMLDPSMQPQKTHIRPLAARTVSVAGDGKNRKEKMDNKKTTQMKPSIATSSKSQCISSRLHPDQTTAQSGSKEKRKPKNTGDPHAASRLQKANNRRGASLYPTTAQSDQSSRLYPDQTTAQSGSKEKRKPKNTGDPHAASRLQKANNRRGASLYATNNASVREKAIGQKIMQRKSAKEDKDYAKCHHSQQGLRSGKEVKVKPDLKRQEQMRRRLSQRNGGKSQSLKPVRAKLERDPSSPKGSTARPENNDPCRDLSNESTLTTVGHDSSSSSGILKYDRLSSSGKDRRYNESNKIEAEKTQTRGDSSPLMKSLLIRRAAVRASEGSMPTFPLLHNSLNGIHATTHMPHLNIILNKNLPMLNTISLKHSNVGKKPALVSRNENVANGSFISKECITEDSSGNQGDSSFYGESGLDDLNGHCCCSMDNAYMTPLQHNDDVVESSVVLSESGIECDGWEPSNYCTSIENLRPEVATVNSSYVFGIAQNTCQSSCGSSMEDVGDTASSYEIGGHKKRQPVSYSGKSTATILQELLRALNSSAKQSTLEDEPKQNKSDVSGMTSTDSALRFDVCRTIKATGNGSDASMDYIKERNCDDSAGSTPYFYNFLQDTTKATRKLSIRGNHSLEESTDECWQPSPTSSSVHSVQDESSDCSESSTCIQERKGSGHESLKCMLTIPGESYRDFVDSRHIANDDKLMGSTSHKYHIDIFLHSKAKQIIQSEEDYIRHIVGSAKLSPGDVYSARLRLSSPLIESALFNKMEEHAKHLWEWGIKPEHEGNNMCILDEYMGSHYEEAARANRKLVFDCVCEALSLDIGNGEQELQQNCMQFLHLSSPIHHSRSVYRQITDWREMVCGMNIDDMVEKAMNTGIGKWVDFSSEVCEIAVEMEASIFKGLIDELVLDLSTVCQKVPTMTGRAIACL